MADLPSTKKRRMRAKLIFNPGSGEAGESPVQLMDVISAMQAWKLVPEAYLVEPGVDLPAVVQNALEEGIRMFVVCGGDGTIDVVAGALARHKRHPRNHTHRYEEQCSPQPGDSGGYPGSHRHPANGPAHQSGHGPGRIRRNKAVFPGSLLGGAVFGPFPGGR